MRCFVDLLDVFILASSVILSFYGDETYYYLLFLLIKLLSYYSVNLKVQIL